NQWIAFHPDNKHVVTASVNGDKIFVWDLEKLEEPWDVLPVGTPGGVTQPPRYSSDGKKMIVGIGQTAVVYDTDGNKKQPAAVALFTAQDIRPVRPGAPGASGDKLAAVGFDEKDVPLAVIGANLQNQRVLGLWEVETKKQRANNLWFLQGGPFLKGAAVTPDGQGVIVIDNQATKIWSFDPAAATKGWTFKQVGF